MAQEEVRALTVQNTRPLVTITLKKARRHFGGVCALYDTDAAEQESVDIRSTRAIPCILHLYTARHFTVVDSITLYGVVLLNMYRPPTTLPKTGWP